MFQRIVKYIKRNKIEVSILTAIGVTLFIKYLLITPMVGDIDGFLDIYKFTYSDSFDWIANGVRFLENDSITFRNLGLPLIISILNRLGAIYLLPLINQGIFFLMISSIYYSVKSMTKNLRISLAIALLVFFNYSLNLGSNYILADFYAVAFIATSICFLIRNKWYLSFLSLTVSMLFQNFGYYLFILWILYYIYLFRNQIIKSVKDLRNNLYKLFIIFLPSILALLVILPWHLYKFLEFNSFFYTKVTQFELIKPNIANTIFYIFNTHTFFGFVMIILLGLLLLSFFKHREILKNRQFIFLVSGFLITWVFWVHLYDWQDRRFLVYLTPWIYLILGYLVNKYISRIRNIIFFTVLVLIIYFNSLPLGGFLNGQDLMIFHNYYITKSDIANSNFNISRRDGYESPLMNISPVMYDSIKNSEYYRNVKFGHYNQTSKYVEENYNNDLNCINMSDEVNRVYIINSVLLISFNSDLDSVKYNCTN